MPKKDNTINEIAKALKASDRVAIFWHTRPDGDAIGSGLALRQALINAGKTVDAFCDDPVPERLSFLPHVKDVQTPDPDDITPASYDTLIAIDCADDLRVGRSHFHFSGFEGPTICIDHHISNPRFCMYNIVFDSPATCQSLPDILDACGYEITPDIANLLLCGVLTDSGNFAHKDVTPDTLRVAARLVECGANLSDQNYRLFDRQTRPRAKLYAKMVDNMQYFLGYKVAAIVAMKSDLMECEANSALTEGVVDFPLSIDGVEVALSMLEVGENHFKVSLRSKGIVDVSKIAVTFGGGGHELAAGCALFGTLNECYKTLLEEIVKYLPDIDMAKAETDIAKL